MQHRGDAAQQGPRQGETGRGARGLDHDIGLWRLGGIDRLQDHLVNQGALVARAVGGFEAQEVKSVGYGESTGGEQQEGRACGSEKAADLDLVDGEFQRLDLAFAARGLEAHGVGAGREVHHLRDAAQSSG